MASQKLSVYSINRNENTNWNLIIENLMGMHSDDIHIVINEQTNDFIGGCYVYESFQNQTLYNAGENKFETTIVKKINVLKFDIFASNDIMMLWGNKKVVSLFLTSLEKASTLSLTITPKEPDFKKMIERLLEKTDVLFTRMKINDIVIEKGILANCSVNLKHQDNISDLISKYIGNISQITFTIGSYAENISITLYSNGSITVYKDRDDISEETINTINFMIGGSY